MKQAIMYGAGNIGRGFIGVLFSQSGYHVTFVDIAETVVTELSGRKCYPLRYVSDEGHEDFLIENVTAINGNDTETVSDQIAKCDILATAVGARVIPVIAPNIAAGIRKRIVRDGGPLNIIICENLPDAHRVLGEALKNCLTAEEHPWFDKNVGLIEASIGRMVPIQTEEMKNGEPLRVCVEKYGFLPVDRDGFKGEIPEIKNMIPFSPFEFYYRRKLYIHNCGHAICAYLGNILELPFIHESIDVPEIRILVQNAMLESAHALSRHYHMEISPILDHITDLLGRFSNAALGDTNKRVGADPARKLAPGDRLIGSSLMALSEDVYPSCLAVGAAAAVCRLIKESDAPEQSMEEAARVLADISKLPADSELAKMILERYALFLAGRDLSDIRRFADRQKNAHLTDII